jgi:hypothetical protein
MLQIQATIAMEQKQIRLNILVTAAAGTCFGTRSNAISSHHASHQNLIPGHLGKFQTIIKEGLSIWRISQDLQTKTSYDHPSTIFIPAPTQNIFKILMQGPFEEGFNRISTRSSHKGPAQDQRPLTAFH